MPKIAVILFVSAFFLSGCNTTSSSKPMDGTSAPSADAMTATTPSVKLPFASL